MSSTSVMAASDHRRTARARTARVVLATVVVLTGACSPALTQTASECSDTASRGGVPSPPANPASQRCPGGQYVQARAQDLASRQRQLTTRDKYLWPFASTSIWNMPIGSEAVYDPLNLAPPTTAFGTDEVYLTFSPTAPVRSLIDRGYWWPWRSGTAVRGRDTGVAVRVPDNWIIPPPTMHEYPNRASAALERDDSTTREWGYAVRPSAGSDISMFEGPRARLSLTGDGLQGRQVGAHGGSAMTAVGGTIRRGELTDSTPIRHAIAVTVNLRKWGTKQGGNITDGFRWPATTADSEWNAGAGVGYGTVTGSGGSSKNGLGMGTLLALPPSVDLTTLHFETHAGAKLAWTHQNYGAYVVDNSRDPGNWDVHRLNVEAAASSALPWLDTYPGVDTPFGRDMVKIFTRLAVVDNNSPSSVGGGGTPRQPLAPPLRK